MSDQPTLSASEFATRWKASTRTERAAAQEHFIDICRMLGVKAPNEADPTGEWYAFEKGAEKQDGSDGFADVWMKGHFAWEYKKKRANLGEAYKQLLQYREALENPPLLVVCDLNRFEIHTNFTGTKKVVYAFTLDDLLKAPAEPLRWLRAVIKDPDPESLKPQQTRAQITEEVAARFAELAERLGPAPKGRGHDPHAVAHFLTKLLFCLFAEDVELLPRGLFERLLQSTLHDPARFMSQVKLLFEKMATRPGGDFGTDKIEWFNGGLFADSDVLPLEREDLELVLEAAKLDWSNVEPAILGTLFERGLDPKKRSQLGAHYTDKTSILRVVEPVVMQPLRREFDAMKAAVLKALGKVKSGELTKKEKEAATKARNVATSRYRAFLDRLRTVTVLDPACGSGNFLYVTLQLLKDLEKEAILWAAETVKTTQEFPGVGPQVVRGLELNDYAAELARVTIWVGQIQWMIANGFSNPTDPVLKPLQSVQQQDAILDRSDPTRPRPASWPDAEFVVGNPPFLGGKKMRTELGDDYVDALFQAWDGKVPREADLVAYWHEKARQAIQNHRTKRAGLLATQGIRGGANQQVLKRIIETGQILAAWSDEPWVVEGAAVRVSVVVQDDGRETARFLDGQPVAKINADLTAGGSGTADLTQAKRLKENLGVSFMGDTKGGAFDISREQARKLVDAHGNPHGKPNSDVVKPWINGLDVTRRPQDMFIIDFGTMTEKEAALYEMAFKYVAAFVQPERAKNKRAAYKERWWIHVEARPAMIKALAPLKRFIGTARVAKHRLFAWIPAGVLPDSQVIVIAREDDYVFGVLHSRPHELWALAKGTQLEDRPRYTPTSTFETFPFPWPLNTPEAELTEEQRAHRDAIATAAKELDEKRSAWLNPPKLVSVVQDSPLPPRLVPKDEAAAKELKERTLTKLYNQRPGWLDLLHEELDREVLAAYRLPDDISDEDLLAALLRLNDERTRASGPPPTSDDGGHGSDGDGDGDGDGSPGGGGGGGGAAGGGGRRGGGGRGGRGGGRGGPGRGGEGPLELRNAVPRQVLDAVAKQYRIAAAEAVNDFSAQRPDEDSITGAFGSVIRSTVKGSVSVGGRVYTWRSSSDRVGARTEKTAGVDAFVQVVVEDENGHVTAWKLLPVQAKKMWHGANADLNGQCQIIEERFPHAGVVVDYRPDGYRATTCAAALEAGGNRRRLPAAQDLDLGDVLADQFLECKVGIVGARYEGEQEEVVIQEPEGGERRVSLRPTFLISTEIKKK